MNISPQPAITPDLVASLLALPAGDTQINYLHSANLFNAAGLTELVDYAANIAGSHPAQAQQLASICATTAVSPIAPNLIPRATYIQAQTYAIHGQFTQAYSLIEAARDGFEQIGLTTDALRTQIGLMNVLGASGKYQEAINAGQMVLNSLDGGALPAAETHLLAAMAQRNLGICYRRMGRYEDALAAYSESETQYGVIGDSEAMAHLQVNQGITLINLGRASEATTLLQTAVSHFTNAENPRMQAKALNNQAIAYQLMGQYSHALDTFAQASRLFEISPSPVEQSILLLDTADAYLALNLNSEAIDAYQEARVKLEEAGMIHYLGRVHWGLGVALSAQNEYETASIHLLSAADMFSAAKNAPLQAGALLEQAAVLAAQGRRASALVHARQALLLVAGNEWPVQHVFALMRIAELVLPDVETAVSLLLQAQTIAEPLNLPHLRYRLNQRLGHVYLLQGQHEEAQELLETAVTEIEQLRGTLAREAVRASFLRDKTAAYEDLVQLHLNKGSENSLQQAFAVAEQAKSRSLVDLLMGLTETKLDTEIDDELATRLQNLQVELNTVYNEAFDSNSGGERYVSQALLQERTAELESEISRLRLQIVDKSDSFAHPLPLETIQRQLPHDMTMLAYHIVGEEVMAFVQCNGRLQAVRHLSSVPTIHRLLQRLTMQWDRFRIGQSFTNRHMTQLEHSTQRVLSELFVELMAPVRSLLPQSDDKENPSRLLIIPHDLLHQIPFHALFDGQQYLLEQYEISYAPSATVSALCHKRVHKENGRALIMGVASKQIPFVTAEAEAIAKQLPHSHLLMDADATIATLKQSASTYNLLHIACHGLFRSDNPMFSALKLHDGWLTAGDVMQLDLSGAMVTLSACESGRSGVIAGDEIIGLARAFLGAGANTLVVSLWLVEDKSTASLMSNWYQEAQYQNRAAALRSAQLALKETHPHPYYWAPFMMIGQS